MKQSEILPMPEIEEENHFVYFAYFISRNGDEYKSPLMASTEDAAINEAWDAFMDSLNGMTLEHIADGTIIKYVNIYKNYHRNKT